MRKKTVLITVITAIIVLIAAGIFILLPRVQIKGFAEEYIFPVLELTPQNGGYFEDHGAEISSGTEVQNGIFRLTLPDGYVPDGDGIYANGEGEYAEVSSESPELPDTLETIDLNEFYDVKLPERNDLSEAYRAVGAGGGDTVYGSLKSAVLLKKSDYSFWDIDKAFAFCKLATLSGIYFGGGEGEENLVYERGNVKGIVSVSEGRSYKNDGESYDTYYSAFFIFFNENDLDTPYFLNMTVRSPENAFGVLNSVEFN